MIPPLQFRDYIIRPVLAHLSEVEPLIGSRAAENLLLGTAIMESRLKHMAQFPKNPLSGAVSMFQVELATFHDIYHRYLKNRRPDLFAAVNEFLLSACSPSDNLLINQHFACCIARIKYFMSPLPLPAADNIDALGQYWDEIYNVNPRPDTSGARWALLFRKHVNRKEW